MAHRGSPGLACCPHEPSCDGGQLLLRDSASPQYVLKSLMLWPSGVHRLLLRLVLKVQKKATDYTLVKISSVRMAQNTVT